MAADYPPLLIALQSPETSAVLLRRQAQRMVHELQGVQGSFTEALTATGGWVGGSS